MIKRNSKGQFVKGHKVSKETRKKISLVHKGKKYSKETRKKISEALKGNKHCLGRKLSNETKQKMSKNNCNKGRFDENSPYWKGDKAGNEALHQWVTKHKGKASNYLCKCGEQAQHWANKDHSYKRSLEDYIAKCCSCHLKWDYKNNKRNKVRNPS